MARYIDADKVLQELGDEPLNWTDSDAEIQEQMDYRLFKDIIERQPTADVVEVKHGEWIVNAWDGKNWAIIPYKEEQHTDPFCSRCKEPAMRGSRSGRYEASNYCPHCGAKMDGRSETK